MQNPRVPQIASSYLNYFYAKHCIAPLAGRTLVWPYIMSRFKRLEKGQLAFDSFDGPLSAWLSQQTKCCFCEKRTKARAELIVEVESSFNLVPFCKACQKARGEMFVWKWWHEVLGQPGNVRPNLPFSLWIRMCYERRLREGRLTDPMTSTLDLWAPHDCGERYRFDFTHYHCESEAEEVWQNDLSARYPWRGEPTIGQLLSWSYADLALISRKLDSGETEFLSEDYQFRYRFYHDMNEEVIAPSSLLKDELHRLTQTAVCAYCGSRGPDFTLDHVLARSRGGEDEGFNLVLACRSCNSSKCDRDLLAWYAAKGEFPSLPILRRYLKLVIRRCKEKGRWNRLVSEFEPRELPFDFECLPLAFPDLRQLRTEDRNLAGFDA